MPGEVSRSYPGPGPDAPYVPSWCYDPPGPRMCACGHHEGYHNDAGECLQRLRCGCKGLPPEPDTAGVPDLDGERGMAWWNGLGDEDRSFWMKLSLGTSPADAWAYFKRCGADAATTWHKRAEELIAELENAVAVEDDTGADDARRDLLLHLRTYPVGVGAPSAEVHPARNGGTQP